MIIEPQHNESVRQHTPAEQQDQFTGSRAAKPPLMQLTASSGNNVVQRANPLTKAQVQTALTFYSGRSTDFTAAIIKEIQKKVGVTESGTMDEATVQGVATFQQGKGLTVNGQLDTQTITLFFPHGLQLATAQAGFASDFLGIQWNTHKTAQAKAQALVDAINNQLKTAGVPGVGVKLQGGLGAASGHFNFPTWEMALDQNLFAQANIPQAQLDKMANYVYHESRHAEQWFNMAQVLAGQGKTAAQITTTMGIPRNIADEAVKSPIAQGSSKALVVSGWWENVYGSGRVQRNTTINNVVTNNTPANYAAYKAMPEESDAFQAGDGFDAALAAERAKPKQNK